MTLLFNSAWNPPVAPPVLPDLGNLLVHYETREPSYYTNVGTKLASLIDLTGNGKDGIVSGSPTIGVEDINGVDAAGIPANGAYIQVPKVTFTDYTVYIVSKALGPAPSVYHPQIIYAATVSSVGTGYYLNYILNAPNNKYRYDMNGTAFDIIPGASGANFDSTPKLFSIVISSGVSVQTLVDNVSQGIKFGAVTLGNNYHFIGRYATRFADMAFSMFLVYDSAHGPTEQAAVADYVNYYYGLSI